MLFSTLWSEIPFIAFRRWIRAVIVVIVALLVASESTPRRAFESIFRRMAYVLIPFSVLLIKYYPRLGVDYARWSGEQMWTGVTDHKNSLGKLCLVGSAFLLWSLYEQWRKPAGPVGRVHVWADVCVLIIALYLLRGADNAYSATSVATLALGTVSFLILLWLRRLPRPVALTGLVVLVLLMVGVGVSAPFMGGSNLAFATSALGRDETLTGRTKTWAELVPVVKSEPLLGFGFGSFWTTSRREFYEMSNAHNGYLDTLLDSRCRRPHSLCGLVSHMHSQVPTSSRGGFWVGESWNLLSRDGVGLQHLRVSPAFSRGAGDDGADTDFV